MRGAIAAAAVILLGAVPSSVAQVTERVSVTTGGFQARGPSSQPDITPDGRFIAFSSSSPDLALGLPPSNYVFLHDRITGTTRLVALGWGPTVSDDGRFVAFISDGLVAGDTNGAPDAYVWDAVQGTIEIVSVYFGQEFTAISADISGDGRYVVYWTPSGTAGYGRVIVFDRVLHQSSDPGPAALASAQWPRISRDGRFVGYTVLDNHLPEDTNGFADAYVYDRTTGLTRVASTNFAFLQGNADSRFVALSDNGNFVLFTSLASNLVPGDSAQTNDLFIKNLQVGSVVRVNVGAGGIRGDVDFGILAGSLTGDGRWASFWPPGALAAGDTNSLSDVYLYDAAGAALHRVSIATSGAEAAGGSSIGGVASADGRLVAFASDAHNLVPGDTNFATDVFVHDRQGERPCAVAISPSGLTVVSRSGGGGTLVVTADAGCAWTAASNAAFIHLVGATSGVGSGTVPYAVEPYTGVTEIRSGAIVVGTEALGLRQLGTVTQPPFGVFEAPAAAVTNNVTGAIALGGWALDDVQVTRIRVYRDPVPGEGGAQIYIGDAVQVAGARPDVAVAGSSYPYNTSAGWGLLVLTNGLPGQGNGSFVISVYADDYEGHTTKLGSKILNCTNAAATVPFGTIDTPGQGEVVSGTIVNFGWALTPQPKSIPLDGSTIGVFVDGVFVGHPVYGNYRPDISMLFPQYANADSAVGYFMLDTRGYPDGVHTIAWGVTDSEGAAAGIGSRFFTIRNGTAPPPQFATSAAAAPAGDAAIAVEDAASVAGPRRVRVVHTSGVERIAFAVDPSHAPDGCTRYSSAALPVGAALDASTGLFTWQPVAGFGGTHDLTFVRTSCAGTAESIRVRIVFQ